MLKSLNFSQLLSFDLYDLAKVTLQIYDHCSVNKGELMTFVEDVRESLASYEQTFQRRVISCVMERKTLQASKRDEAYIAFYRFVEASCHRASKKHSMLGTELLAVLQQNAWHTKNDGYQRQSTGLPALIRELRHNHYEMIARDISVRETRPLLEGSLRSLYWITDRLYQSAPSEELGYVVHNLNKVVRKLTSKVEKDVCVEIFSDMVS
jgi:hypothetical protein